MADLQEEKVSQGRRALRWLKRFLVRLLAIFGTGTLLCRGGGYFLYQSDQARLAQPEELRVDFVSVITAGEHDIQREFTKEQEETILRLLSGLEYRGAYGMLGGVLMERPPKEEPQYCISLTNPQGGQSMDFYLGKEVNYSLHELISPKLGNSGPVLDYLDQILDIAD